MGTPRTLLAGFLTLASTVVSTAAIPGPLQQPLATLKAVGPEGTGNAAAREAWRQVAAAPGTALPALLESMDGANDYALNWLRAAVESVAQRETAAGRALPVAELEAFLKDTRHHPRARRLAYELILQANPDQARSLVPTFVNDPANDLRRDAVQLLMDAATNQISLNKTAAIQGYQKALSAARDADQIESIAKTLGDLGERVDLQKTFGWVTRWKLIGPFDNTANAGFSKAYPPEQALDLAATHDGKSGPVRWVDFASTSEYGWVDFNKPFDALKEVAGYAVTEFWSESNRPAEIRLGCKNGWKVWLNGQFLFGRDEYHTGAEIDQFRLPVELKAGRNVILVKCTQNEQKEDWTKEWEFQLRVTDAQGTPIVSTR